MIKKVLVFFILFIASALYGQQTNRVLFNTLLDSIIIKHSMNGKVHLLFTAPESLREFQSSAEGKVVSINSLTEAETMSVVLLGATIEYTPVRSGWFSDELYKRQVSLEYAYTVNGVLQSSSVAVSDTMVSSSISSVEENGNLYKGKFLGKAGISGFTEPVLMTILTGGVVYLFYSVRGK